MNRLLALLIFTGLLAGCQSPASENQPDSGAPARTFRNPILAGFNPDPGICRVGEDYYLVTSTFAFFPGIPIMHSKDLVHWNQIGAAIDRTEQMDMTDQGMSRGLFAPTINYHQGTFYVICTLIDRGGNFIVTADNPAGPYSNPYWLPELDGGIDPSLFFDEDGTAWVVYNHVAPDNEPLYDGHRTIRMRQLDLATMKPAGEEFLLVNGGTDLAKKPVWIEAPHIYQRNGYYYLMAAEGGTAYNHSEVIFRSKDITGPYEVYAGNPILTQRHLDPARPNPITTTGHADLVEASDGEWWAVFLGCRPYEGNHFNTGRETFLTPVTWTEDGWPVINPDFEEVQYEYPVPTTAGSTTAEISLSPDVHYDIDLTQELDPRWVFLRNVKESWYTHDKAAGSLTLQLRPETIAATGNPSLMMRRQPHLYGEAMTHVRFSPEQEGEMAGLVVLMDQDHYYFLNKTADRLQVLKKSADGFETLTEVPWTEAEAWLKITANGSEYHFSCSEDGETYTEILSGADARYLSTQTAGGFIGCMYGLYATSSGESSANQAVFHAFRLQSADLAHMAQP